MIVNRLPSVLFVPSSNPQHPNSISVERALKLILKVLETPDGCTDDEVDTAIMDARTMLSRGFE